MALSPDDIQTIRMIVEEAMRPRLLRVEDIMREEQIKTRKTAKRVAERRGVPERTYGGDKRTSKDQPLRYSRLEWEEAKEANTQRVKNYINE